MKISKKEMKIALEKAKEITKAFQEGKITEGDRKKLKEYANIYFGYYLGREI